MILTSVWVGLAMRTSVLRIAAASRPSRAPLGRWFLRVYQTGGGIGEVFMWDSGGILIVGREIHPWRA